MYEQQRGLPIGGPLSDLGASLLLGLQEATWRQLAPWRDAAGWSCLRTAGQVDAWVAQARYVDDDCTISCAFCAPCLESYTREQHPGIPFDTECRGSEGPLRWLDLVVRCERWPLHLGMHLGERLWLTGEEQAPSKYRVAPFLGAQHADEHALRSYVRSHSSRWTQVQLASKEAPRAHVGVAPGWLPLADRASRLVTPFGRPPPCWARERRCAHARPRACGT